MKIVFGGLSRFSIAKLNLQRKSFAELSRQDIEHFKTFMKANCVVTEESEIEAHNTCFRKHSKGNSKLLLLPQNTDQVSKILSYCNQRRLAVVPQGGNTGLVGGSVPVFDEIILSLKNMNKIEKFDAVSSVVSVEAGVVLQKLNQFLAKEGCEAPLDLGAKGSCHVGGNASTNAGGKYVIKYGSFRSHILGLEAVTPNGEVLDLRSEIMKDNTGYDLKQLFIGGEGTLGVITKLNIHCPKVDPLRRIIVFKTDSFQAILESLPKIKTLLGKNLCALQILDSVAYNTVIKKLHKPLFSSVQPNQFLLFIESSTDSLDDFFEQMSAFNDSVISSNQKEFNQIWRIRQDVTMAARMLGKVYAYDLSFDVKEWMNLVQDLRQQLKTVVMGYGHIGDGNIHVNIIAKEGQEINEQQVYELVAKKKGSISAEHGVGLYKHKYLYLQKPPQVLAYYRLIKKLFDPHEIMNPYKVIPE